jgi:hypothetical protein
MSSRATAECSTRVRWPVPSLAGPVQPTAHALDAEVAATPANSPPAGLGVRTWVHDLPFQCWARGYDGENQLVPPTAQTSRAELAATPMK